MRRLRDKLLDVNRKSEDAGGDQQGGNDRNGSGSSAHVSIPFESRETRRRRRVETSLDGIRPTLGFRIAGINRYSILEGSPFDSALSVGCRQGLKPFNFLRQDGTTEVVP